MTDMGNREVGWQIAHGRLKLITMVEPNMPTRGLPLRDVLRNPAGDATLDDEPLALPGVEGDAPETEDTSLFDDEDELEDVEDIGLDTDTGPEEGFGNEISTEEEAGSWIGDATGTGDLSLDDDEFQDADGEDGWAEGCESDAQDDLDDALGVDEGAEPVVDGGDEGFDEDQEQELDDLPPLVGGLLSDANQEGEDLVEGDSPANEITDGEGEPRGGGAA
jgi:hypothetical protein